MMRALSILMLAACSSGTPVPVSLAEAPTATQGSLAIEGGLVDPAQLGALERSCAGVSPSSNRGSTPCVEHHTYMVPVGTDDGVEQPVRAWVTCPSRLSKTRDQCLGHLKEHPRPSGRVLWRFRDGAGTDWNRAILASGLASVENAPVLLIE